jgi:integrase/recombinase XerD
MTRLRKMMLEELQRRNFSEDTIRHYIHTVEDFARHFNRPPDRLGLRHIREYQAHLFQKRKLSSGSVTNHLAALRFSYIHTLKKAWSVAETPYSKKNHHQPGRSRAAHRCRWHSLPSHSAHDALRYRSAAC